MVWSISSISPSWRIIGRVNVTVMAVITLQSSDTSPAVGQLIEISVHVESEGESLNAYEGVLTVPDVLSVVEVRDTASLVRMWLTKPQSQPYISFSGITPGGFNGSGLLFTVLARVEKPGTLTLTTEDLSIYKNDGLGTEVEARVVPLTLQSVVSGQETPLLDLPQDTEPPQEFVIDILRDKTLTNNDLLLSFATTDSGTGVSYYEMIDTDGIGERVSSPVTIKREIFSRNVLLRAVDYNGNTREVVIEIDGVSPLGPFPFFLCIAIAACAILGIGVFIRRRHAQHSGNHR